jgi:hypothetical protein
MRSAWLPDGEIPSGGTQAGDGAERVLDLLDIGSGEALLIHGASGALGTIAVQLVVARGARVIGTAGPANQEYVTSLGATALVYEVAPHGWTRCSTPSARACWRTPSPCAVVPTGSSPPPASRPATRATAEAGSKCAHIIEQAVRHRSRHSPGE